MRILLNAHSLHPAARLVCYRWCSSVTSGARGGEVLVDPLGHSGPAPSQRTPDLFPVEDSATDSIQRAVRVAVLAPLGKDGEPSGNDRGGSPTGGSGDNNEQSASPYTVRVADKFGMPADLPRGSPRTFDEILAMCPDPLQRQLRTLITSRRWVGLTHVQQAAIPLALEYRDLLCIAPTATGKTLSYALPTLLRLLLDDAAAARAGGGSNRAADDSDAPSADITRRSVETLLLDKISKGEVCRYCELSIAENPVCPMTGAPHPPPPDAMDDALGGKARRAMRVEELSSTSEPRVLILVPTSQLAEQTHRVCRTLHADYTIRCMVRAASAEEQRRHLRALEGTDVLISTPETILPALLKGKLSLRRVRTLVIDEVDDMVSLNHFEKLKIVLGALPKGRERPQRLLFGASLPPAAYQMIKERMLLPSHRFVLADVKTDHLGHPVTTSSDTGSGGGGLRVSAGQVTQLVFMVGRVEKLHKLAWLYSTGKLTEDQRTLIFCNSRHNVAYVADRLAAMVPGLHVTTLTSHASATARDGVMKMFSTGVSTCLVCTDVLSRGIDFQNVVYVVHYDMPTDMDTWLHRCGRCGRNGKRGYAYTFFQPENIRMSKPLVAHLRQYRQLIPPKLQEYARQGFVDVFKSSLFHSPTRPYRRDDPQNTTPVIARGTPRFPDYRQEGVNKHFRPL